jgi:hypothetical protein
MKLSCHTYMMYDFHGRKVFYFENADTSYAYDGSRYTINGYVRDSKEDIMDKLLMRITSTKDWIKAQLLFWGIVESTLNPKHLLRDELAEMLMVGLQARGNQRVGQHPIKQLSSWVHNLI